MALAMAASERAFVIVFVIVICVVRVIVIVHGISNSTNTFGAAVPLSQRGCVSYGVVAVALDTPSD